MYSGVKIKGKIEVDFTNSENNANFCQKMEI